MSAGRVVKASASTFEVISDAWSIRFDRMQAGGLRMMLDQHSLSETAPTLTAWELDTLERWRREP